MSKNIDDLKKKIKESIQPNNLLFQWVRDKKITFNQFEKLIEFINEEKIRNELYDSFN